jgi:mono/diheme cytochrome c family protein
MSGIKRNTNLAWTAGAVTLCAVLIAPNAGRADDGAVARGKYLAIVGDCVACHSAPGGKALAGGRDIETPFGPMAAPNITPDTETGIGSWTDDQFYRAMHEGIGAHGEYLYPVFPYPWFTKVTRDDVLAIKAYLFSLSPVHAPKKPNHLMFPFDVRLGVGAWDAIFFTAGTFQPDASKSAEYNRGAYLVEGLGHCGDCHTPKNLAEAPINGEAFAGEPIQHWFAPNITSDVREGIGGWSDDQLVAFLKTGVAPGKAVVAGPMAETVHDSLSQMSDADLHAIALYLKALPAKQEFAAKSPGAAMTGPHTHGADVYVSYCASCHQLNGVGVAGAIPALVGDGAVNAQGPEDVIRVVLGGLPAQQHYAPMPALGADLTDQQIADVTNYVRTAWSNHAPATTGPGLVGQIRAETATLQSGREHGCPDVSQPELKAALDNQQNGIADLLRQTNDGNLLQNVGQIVDRAKAAAPGLSQADLVNGLTVAYCPIAGQSGGLAARANRHKLNNFSQLVYSKLAAGRY